MTAALENIDKLVQRFRDFNEFGDMDQLEFSVVSFRTLLQETMAEVRSNLHSQSVFLTEDVQNDPLWTVGDTRELAKAVCGFLTRAVEFTGSGGSVQIRAHEENGKIKVDISATRTANSDVGDGSMDLSAACKIWRLHGGSCSVTPTCDGQYLVIGELPVIRLPAC